LLPSGSHLFTVDKDNCRNSLLLARFMRRGASAFSDARFVSSLGCVRACRVWPLVGGGWCVILLGVGGIG